MKIIQSSHIAAFNYYEKNLKELAINKLKNFKIATSDIMENLYLILVSLIPLFFYPAFYYVVDKEYNFIYGIFNNPDIMLLSIPYIMHCILWISSREGLRWKKPTVGWYALIIIVSVLVYLLLKLNSTETSLMRIAIIWLFFGMTIVSGIIGTFVVCLHKEEE